jgi:hypothetical protein
VGRFILSVDVLLDKRRKTSVKKCSVEQGGR